MSDVFTTFAEARRFGWGAEPVAEPAPSPTQVAHALRAGRCPHDRDFDRFLPKRLRAASPQYWTPLRATTRAASWFDSLGVKKVVDIGSGTGKFCIASALQCKAEFVGVEQRAELVATARVVSQLYGVERRVSFLHETFGEVAPPEADAYYLFNPFEENVFGFRTWLDDSVEHSGARFERELQVTWSWLAAARPDTYVVTYNGFGRKLPASYELLRAARDLPCVLKLWRQRRPCW